MMLRLICMTNICATLTRHSDKFIKSDTGAHSDLTTTEKVVW